MLFIWGNIGSLYGPNKGSFYEPILEVYEGKYLEFYVVTIQGIQWLSYIQWLSHRKYAGYHTRNMQWYHTGIAGYHVGYVMVIIQGIYWLCSY